MKYIILLATIITITSCSKIENLTLSNSSSRNLVNQPVVIPRSSLTVPEGKYLLLKDADGLPIPLQHDDLDKDGQWDELAFQIDFEPQEKITVLYEWVALDKLPNFEKRTNIYLGHSQNRNNEFVSIPEHTRPKDHVVQSIPFLYQAEGPMWESDLVAFRTYFDSRNGKDIFGKTKPALNVHAIGNGANYHKLQEWGMDVLKVGNSLGAGAIAMLKDDSLYRLTNTSEAKFETIVIGPVRSIMKLTYTGWQVSDKSYDLEETISIWAGKRHYESELILTGGNETDTLVTGIVNLKNLPPRVIKTDDRSMLYTHGKQSENKDVLGMALIIPKVNCYDFAEAPEEGQGVTNTYTAYLKSTDGTYRYAFVAGWELEDAQLKAEDFFAQELKNTTMAQNGLITL